MAALRQKRPVKSSVAESRSALEPGLVEAPADPWLALLQRVRGKVEFDGLERVSSQAILDMLEEPQRSRTAGVYRRLARLMAELGWAAVRVRDLTRGGYKEQVRGYVRGAAGRSHDGGERHHPEPRR
jgi:hypothetical protein